MALLALKIKKMLENDTTWKKRAGRAKIKTTNSTTESLPLNMAQTFASVSTVLDFPIALS